MAIANVLKGLIGQGVILRLPSGEVAGTVRRVEPTPSLAYLDTTLQQARPSPLAQDQVLMVQTEAEIVIDLAAVSAVIAPKQITGEADTDGVATA